MFWHRLNDEIQATGVNPTTSRKIMAEVVFDSKYISASDIARCVAQVSELANHSEHDPFSFWLEIKAQKEIKYLDPRFFSYLFLFKAKYPTLHISLSFNHNRLIINNPDQGVASRIVQCGIWGFIQTGEIIFDVMFANASFQSDFNTMDGDGYTFDITKIQPGFNFISYLTAGSLFILLRSTPLSGSFGFFFEEEHLEKNGGKIFGLRDVELDVHNLASSEIYEKLAEQIWKNHTYSERYSFLEATKILAFYWILDQLGILRTYWLKQKLRHATKNKFIGSADEITLRQSFDPLLNEIQSKPTFYQFLFLIMCPKIQESDIGTPAAEAFVDRVTNVWNFTKDLGHSLTELARNCINYSSDQLGAISIAAAERADVNEDFAITDLYNSSGDFLRGLPNYPSPEHRSRLQVYVADLGIDGVIPAMKQIMQEEALENYQDEFLLQDLQKLRSGSFKFENLLFHNPEQTLHRQNKRSAARLGLLIFGKHVQESNGLLIASSTGISKERESVLIVGSELVGIGQNALNGQTVPFGTNYYFVIPYNADRAALKSHLPQRSAFTPPKAGDIRGLQHLFEFELVDIEVFLNNLPRDPAKCYIIQIKPELFGIQKHQDNGAAWKTLFEKIKNTDLSGKLLASLDLDVVSEFMGEDELLNMLASWQISLSKLPLIVTNLHYQKFQKLIELNDRFLKVNSTVDYWDPVSATLFYTYAPVGSKRFYFVNALYGATKQHCLKLNRIISRNNFNQLIATVDVNEPDTERVSDKVLIDDLSNSNPAFFNGDALLPLDILLKTRDGSTFFESNADIILNTELTVKRHEISQNTGVVESKKDAIYAVIDSLPGFKISNSHFRLGSKIHISHFYYAKRFFQNSFFASRFAFVLSKDMLAAIENSAHAASVASEGLTIIGYGIYSELMISLIEKFMRSRAAFGPQAVLNHNLVSDAEKLAFIKGDAETGYGIRRNIFVVVPIATTFSTAVKIEEEIHRLDAKAGSADTSRVLGPHFNVLHVSNGPMKGKPRKPDALEASLGWHEVDAELRQVAVRAFYLGTRTGQERIVTQQYYLSLESEWEQVETCKYCFPKGNNFLDERPLFETDTTSVTPSLVFDFPKGRKIAKEDRERSIRLEADLIRYGHHTRNNGHFLYSIDTEKFLARNEDHSIRLAGGLKVTRWLLEIKRRKTFREHFRRADHVLLITTCHYSNAAFINLVNEVLFSSTANIVHYDPSNDFIQNFEIIYGDEITRADRLVFVDDSLKSGSSFLKIYDFVHYTMFRRQRADRFDGLDACIVLVNKSQESTNQFIKSKLQNPHALFAFANYHLFTSLNHDDVSPLVVEEQRYKLLSDNSFLDSLQTHFLKQQKKLMPDSKRIDENKKERYLNMLNATHRLYQYFTDRFPSNEVVDEEALKALGGDEVLKVLTQSPFSQYEPLRKIVFRWVLSALQDHIEEVVLEEIRASKFTPTSFNDLKYLIRRAGLLKSNFLISKGFIDFMERLHGLGGIPALMKQAGGSDIYPFKYFNIFYLAQVKELLLHNEARALRLEGELVSRRNAAGPSSRFLHLLRILRIENSIVIQKFYDLISSEPEWQNLYPTFDSLSSIEPIAKLIEEGIKGQYPKYLWQEEFQRMASSVNDEPASERLWENQRLLNYLWIRRFMHFDETYNDKTLEEKTREIFERIKLLVDPHTGSEKKVGAFFYVKTGEQDSDYHLVYDQNNDDSNELHREHLEKGTFIRHFLDGSYGPERGYQLSIVELHRTGNSWIDLYEVEEDIVFKVHNEGLENTIIGDIYNRIILIRINKRASSSKERAQGVIGLYFVSPDDKITDLNLTRFLHLLRRPFSDFIERHHENNEFRDWSIAETKRKLNVLYGHGREMLLALANSHSDVLPILKMTEQMRHIILFELPPEPLKIIYTKPEVIDREYFENLRGLAEMIFETDFIEDRVFCNISPIQFDGRFSFNRNLLNWICFELLVNAKKNRWVFFEDEEIEIDGETYRMNHVQINASINKQLIVKIRNTSPLLASSQISVLNTRKMDIKKNQEESGTFLIKSVFTEFLPGSTIQFGSFTIDQSPSKEKTGISWFEVTLCLNPL